MSRPLNAPPITAPVADAAGRLTTPWAAWMRDLYVRIGQALGRPTTAIDADVSTLSGDASTLADAVANLDGRVAALEAYPPLPSFSVTTLPAATPAGRLLYVTDETDGAVVAFSDGTDWRRVTDRAVVS